MKIKPSKKHSQETITSTGLFVEKNGFFTSTTSRFSWLFKKLEDNRKQRRVWKMNVSINYVTWFGPLGISKGRSTIHIWRNIYTNICSIYWGGNQEYQRTMFASNYYLRVWILCFVFISLKFNHLSSFSVHDFSRYVAPSSFITFVRHYSRLAVGGNSWIALHVLLPNVHVLSCPVPRLEIYMQF